jgi:hypothetical protein
VVYLGGPGAQFRGENDGVVYVSGAGTFVIGSFAALSSATNLGEGSLLLANLTAGQRALITDVANAALVLGAGTASNAQCIVVGDGNESHGARSVTADSFWESGINLLGKVGGVSLEPMKWRRCDPVCSKGHVGLVRPHLHSSYKHFT